MERSLTDWNETNLAEELLAIDEGAWGQQGVKESKRKEGAKENSIKRKMKRTSNTVQSCEDHP